MKSYARFYYKVYERLLQTPPFANRQEVEIWLRDTWLDIHTDAGAGKQRLAILRHARICPEQGWRDVDKDVCYLDSPETPPIRMFVHNDGTLVVQQMHTDRSEILFAKHGAKPKVRLLHTWSRRRQKRPQSEPPPEAN